MKNNFAEQFFNSGEASNCGTDYDNRKDDERPLWEKAIIENTERVKIKATPIEEPTETFPDGFGIEITAPESRLRPQWFIIRYHTTICEIIKRFGFISFPTALPNRLLPTSTATRNNTAMHYDNLAKFEDGERKDWTLTQLVSDGRRRDPTHVADTQLFFPDLMDELEATLHFVDSPYRPILKEILISLGQKKDHFNVNKFAIMAQKTSGTFYDLCVDISRRAFNKSKRGRHQHFYGNSAVHSNHLITAASGLPFASNCCHGRLGDADGNALESTLYPLIAIA